MLIKNIKEYKLIIFDLNGTLTLSKSPISAALAETLLKLLSYKKIAVISGGSYLQLQTQLIAKLLSNSGFADLFLLPASGTKMYVWQKEWREEFAENISEKDKATIMGALNMVLKSKYARPDRTYGDTFEDRGSEITFSGLGQSAPLEAKIAWDPDRSKREQIAEALRKLLPAFDVRVGGTTSVDITYRGVNKGFGIRKIEAKLGLNPENILFVGDSLFYGGNDFPARSSGVDCLEVRSPDDTGAYIDKWLRELSA